MATKGKVECEKKRERLIRRYREKRQVLIQDLRKAEDFTERLTLYKRLERIPRNASFSRHRNRCWATGRSRGFYRDFGLSRHVIREMGDEGLIPGLRKSSW